MTTQQIYATINDLIEQATGRTDLTVIDTPSLVATGDFILNSSQTLETYLNTLMVTMYRDLIVSRNYTSQLRGMVFGDIEYGLVLRKMSTDMLEFEEEQSVDLYTKQGQSIDQYKINLPTAHQWLFANRTPKQLRVTIQRSWIKEAFQSEAEMNNFIADIFVKIQNKLELAVDVQTRASMMNYAMLVEKAGKQIINLVTIYNNMTGKTLATGQEAMFDADFMRWCTGYIRELANILTTINNKYNLAGLDRFTPVSDQQVCLLSRFVTQLQTTALYSAFNQDYLRMVNNYTIPYWQAQGVDDALDFNQIANIAVIDSTQSPPASINITNVIGMIFDRFALGMYRKELESSVSPYNAAGGYFNHFFKENQMIINAQDEQYLLLTLN